MPSLWVVNCSDSPTSNESNAVFHIPIAQSVDESEIRSCEVNVIYDDYIDEYVITMDNILFEYPNDTTKNMIVSLSLIEDKMPDVEYTVVLKSGVSFTKIYSIGSGESLGGIGNYSSSDSVVESVSSVRNGNDDSSVSRIEENLNSSALSNSSEHYTPIVIYEVNKNVCNEEVTLNDVESIVIGKLYIESFSDDNTFITNYSIAVGSLNTVDLSKISWNQQDSLGYLLGPGEYQLKYWYVREVVPDTIVVIGCSIANVEVSTTSESKNYLKSTYGEGDPYGGGSTYTTSVELDNQGSAWVSLGEKLIEFSEGAQIHTFFSDYAADTDRHIKDFKFTSDGGLWIISHEMGGNSLERLKWATFYDGSIFTEYNSSNSPLDNDDTQRLYIDNNDTPWFSNYSGLKRLNKDGWHTWNTSNSDLEKGGITSIVQIATDEYWVAVSNTKGVGGIYLLKEDEITEVYDPQNSNLPNASISSLILSNDSTVWITLIGYSSDSVDSIGTICRLKNGSIHCFEEGDVNIEHFGLVHQDYWGTVWVSIDTKLYRYINNTFEFIHDYETNPRDIAVDKEGVIWVTHGASNLVTTTEYSRITHYLDGSSSW
ncbi:MAG: hypothetical protein OCC49_13635 [Fibrobacterales bacterium]